MIEPADAPSTDRSDALARTASLRVAPLLAGVVLLAIYVRIGDFMGFQASYGPSLEHSKWTGAMSFLFVADSEFLFWLSHLVLAVPGALLLSWGLAPRLLPAIARLATRIDAAPQRAWRLAAFAFFLLLVAWSIIGRHVFLMDRPITDDETAVTFGARMIAEGHLRIPELQPIGAYPEFFTYHRAGMVSAMDYPGVLLFAALGLVTGLGGVLYALASAVTGVAVAYAAGRWFGSRARVLAAIIWVASPMVSSLSLTEHGHLPSRMFVALAVAFAARLDTGAGSPRRDALLLGAAAGLAFLCRPLEAAAVLTPLVGWLTWRALRPAATGSKMTAAGLARTSPLWILVGALPSIAFFAWYNVQITGTWYLQARFAPGTIATVAGDYGVWDRIGFNLGFNLLMLVVFFLGVPAIAALVAALDRRRPISIVLGLSVATGLLLCLAHNNTGIHSVGPIHLSETVVPLTLLATAGIVRAFAWLAARDLPRAFLTVVVSGYLGIACIVFGVTNLTSLQAQARTQGVPGETLAELGVHHAVVISSPYRTLLVTAKSFAPWGSWALSYPMPDPFFRDDVIFASTNDPTSLRARFPDRALYVMTYSDVPPAIRVAPLDLSP